MLYPAHAPKTRVQTFYLLNRKSKADKIDAVTQTMEQPTRRESTTDLQYLKIY